MQKKANFLSITRAARFLEVSPDTLRRWEAKGIVTPLRTEGGSRRYTLIDLKIAKLNKRKVRFLQIPALFKQNYINSRRDLKIALLTSFIWIFGLLAYQLLTPVFLRPTNPEQRILSAELKEPAGLKIASETTPVKVYAIEVELPSEATPVVLKMAPKVVGQDVGLLTRRLNDTPAIVYTNTLDRYYSLGPVSNPSLQQTSNSKTLSFW